MKLALTILALALLAGTAKADSTWTYIGNSVNDPLGQSTQGTPPMANPCGCALDGSVTFANPLVNGIQAYTDPIVAFSFTDGAFTFNNTNSTLAINPFSLTNTPFNTWFMEVTTLNGQLGFFSENYDNGFEATDSGMGGLYVQGNHGVWSDPVGTPEPGTIALIFLGVVFVATLRLAVIDLQSRVAKLEAKVWEPLA